MHLGMVHGYMYRKIQGWGPGTEEWGPRSGPPGDYPRAAPHSPRTTDVLPPTPPRQAPLFTSILTRFRPIKPVQQHVCLRCAPWQALHVAAPVPFGLGPWRFSCR